jgi:vacuolar-type H+-ATPase subunit I/STV1
LLLTIGQIGQVLSPWRSGPPKDPLPASTEQLSPEHNALPQPAHEVPLSPVTLNEDGDDLENEVHPREAEYNRQTRQPRTQINQMDAEHSQLFQKSKAAIRRLKDELTTYKTRINEQEAELCHRDAVIRELRNNIAQIQDKHQKLEDIVVARQENALQLLVANNGYIPKDDQSIRDELSKLTESIRSWARKHCLNSFADFEGVAEIEKDMVIHQLAEYCSQPDWNSMTREISIPQNKIPMVLLHALLAKDLFGRMFTDPFFAFPGNDSDHTNSAAGYFQRLYYIMLNGT